MGRMTVLVDAGSEHGAKWLSQAVPPTIATCSLLPELKNTVVMDSPQFAELDGRHELEPYIAQLLERLTALALIYHRGFFPGRFALQQVQRGHTSRRTFTFTVVRPMPDGWEDGVAEALQLAESDERVAHALRLLRDPEVTWADLYDVVEFLLDKWPPARSDAELTKLHQRTANYYRHLGSPDENRLPRSPPTIEQSREYVLDRLACWMDEVTRKGP